MEQLYISMLNKYSKLLILLFFIILGFFLYSSQNFKLDASSDTLILEKDEDLKKYRRVIKDYGSNDFLIVTFSDQTKIITQKNLENIKLFINNVEQLDWVENIQSIFDVPLLEVNDQNLTDLVNQILTIESPGVNILDAENELIKSPIFKNLIISEDATSTGVLINFKRDREFDRIVNERARLLDLENNTSINRSYKKAIETEYEEIKKNFDNSRHENIREIRSIIKTFDKSGLTIHLGGVSMIADDTISFVKNDIIVFGIGAFIFILIVLFIVFKKFTWMLVCIFNCIATLIIMLGTVSLLNWKATVISSNFIMLILILSLSMTVHIVVRYRQVLYEEKSLSNSRKIYITLKKMYRPCLFAALTSIFAFATLYTSGIKPVMDFGLMMCTGLVITYISSFIFLPVIIYSFNLKNPTLATIDQKQSAFVFFSKNYSNLLLIFFALIFSVGIYGSIKLKVENSFVDYFKKNTEIYKGMKLIDDKLGGTTPLDIIINFSNNYDDDILEEEFLDFGIEYDKADYWFTREKVDTIKNIHDHLESYSFAGKVLSLASIVRTAENLNSNKEFDSLELSVLYKKLPEDLKEQIIKPYVLIDENQARITMRIIDTHPDLNRADFINELSNFIEKNFSNKGVQVSITGILILYNNMLASLFDSQIKSLSIVFIGIFMMLIILFRSLKIAFAAIIPNLIACFVILGIMGLIQIPLDLMTITIAAITIGIAVDNCIHYVYRYREIYQDTNNHNDTMSKCNETVAVAIKNTSYTIIAGFSILIFSNFYPTIYFGIFTAIAMFFALIGSLTLLPVLLKKLNCV